MQIWDVLHTSIYVRAIYKRSDRLGVVSQAPSVTVGGTQTVAMGPQIIVAVATGTPYPCPQMDAMTTALSPTAPRGPSQNYGLAISSMDRELKELSPPLESLLDL